MSVKIGILNVQRCKYYNLENIIKNYENKNTRNLKQIHSKDLFLIDIYSGIVNKNKTKREIENNDNNIKDYKNQDFIKYNNDNTQCIMNATLFYEEYKYFFNKHNISKEGSNCGSNQSFYKSMEFYDFIKPKKRHNSNYYLVDIKKYELWYNEQIIIDNFEFMDDEELIDNGFSELP